MLSLSFRSPCDFRNSGGSWFLKCDNTWDCRAFRSWLTQCSIGAHFIPCASRFHSAPSRLSCRLNWRENSHNFQAFGLYSGGNSFFIGARNSGNSMSVPVSTLIVTSVMSAHGHPPNLPTVTQNAQVGLIQSFISGMNSTCLSLIGLGVVLSWYKGNPSTFRG